MFIPRTASFDGLLDRQKWRFQLSTSKPRKNFEPSFSFIAGLKHHVHWYSCVKEKLRFTEFRVKHKMLKKWRHHYASKIISGNNGWRTNETKFLILRQWKSFEAKIKTRTSCQNSDPSFQLLFSTCTWARRPSRDPELKLRRLIQGK